jgi:hypothetical protein
VDSQAKNTAPQKSDTALFPYSRVRVLLFGLTFLLLLVAGVRVLQQPSFLPLFGFAPPPQPQKDPAENDESASIDFLTVATLAIEETTAGKFRSGGLGLTRSAWEVLRGEPERPGITEVLYQGQTYKVTYQHDRVWQIEKSWGTTPPTTREVRARVRRYLPLDSHLAETIAKSEDIVVDVYRSHMLARLLSPQPPEPATKKKSKRRPKNLPSEPCVVVHRLSKQRVISTLLHIGAPKPEGYFPPQSQTTPAITTVGKNPLRNEARKEPLPNGKGKIQGKS